MRKFTNLTAIVAAIGLLTLSGSLAFAGTIRVPSDFPTIQDAVDSASAGDVIRVGPGDWCGATIDKTLDIFGEGGATIMGCPSPAPELAGVLRIGFFLPNADASGTTIRHFVFDGQGTSNADLAPLSFAVFARDASNVIVEQNTILGTIQAITNTNGSGWTVNHNNIEDFSVLACDGAFCGGGVGIVFQDRRTDGPRQTDNTAMFNDISGVIPDDFDVFSMAGILVLGAQDGSIIQKNRIAIPDNPTSLAEGQAIVVTDVCCGLPTPFSTAINTIIVKNDGRDSEFAVVVTLDSGGGTGNTVGMRLRGNFGVNDINAAITEVSNRSIKTLVEFP